MNHDQYVASGRLGGLKTKERLDKDPDYFKRNGKKGGQSMLKKYGPEWYSYIARNRGQYITEARFLAEREGE